jgi:hypothetical protein
MSDGFFLSSVSFAGLSASTQAEILSCLASLSSPTRAAVVASAGSDEEDGPADLSENQARKLVEGCSQKTITAIRVIANAPLSGFRMRDVGEALGIDLEKSDIRGVWSAITRRTRNVLGDPDADLIWWDKLADEWVGWVSPTTHRSLRKVMAKRKA